MTYDPSKPDFEGSAYTSMKTRYWGLIGAMRSTSAEIREKKTEYLPKEPRETSKQYNVRLARSFLFPAYDRAIQQLSGKPFSQSVQVVGTMPKGLDTLEHDVDGTGRTLTQFSRQVFESALQFGFAGGLCDYSSVATGDPDIDDEPTSLEEDGRPKFLCLGADRIIGFRAAGSALSQLRVTESVTRADGAYGEAEVHGVRVWNPSEWELWEYAENAATQDQELLPVVEGRAHSFDGIPFEPFYTGQTGFMMAKPPLWNLAETNLTHYQSYSDQRNILRFVRLAILFGKRLTEDGASTKPETLSGNTLVYTDDEAGDLKFCEHSGAGVGAGRQDLEDLIRQMEFFGFLPMVQRTGGVTATARAIDEAKAHSDMEAWITALEDFLRGMYRMAASWLDVELPPDFDVVVDKRFIVGGQKLEDARMLLDAVTARKIPHRLFLTGWQRLGLIEEEEDIAVLVSEVNDAEPGIDEAFQFSPVEDPDAIGAA